MTFGEKVLEFRGRLQLTQMQLAEQLGVSYTTVNRWEKGPIEPTFLTRRRFEHLCKDDKGRWYIPDITKAGDVQKLREKKLYKEFEGYLATKGKLRLFRLEAVRVGFARLWEHKNYALIVATAERLPENVVAEDDKLLMYYDISLGRIK